MKKFIAGMIVGTMIAVGGMVMQNHETHEHLYPLAGIVTEINYTEDTVTFTDCAGLLWAFYGCEDWCEGDIVSCIMHDSNTPESVYDDVIIRAYYAGIIEDGAFWISNK